MPSPATTGLGARPAPRLRGRDPARRGRCRPRAAATAIRRSSGRSALLACVAVAHAITHLDLLHHYLRVPFVVVLSFYALDRAAGRAEAAARAAGFALAAASLALTAWVLLA